MSKKPRARSASEFTGHLLVEGYHREYCPRCKKQQVFSIDKIERVRICSQCGLRKLIILGEVDQPLEEE